MRKNFFFTSITSLIFIVITLIGITHTRKIEHENEEAKNKTKLIAETYGRSMYTIDVSALATSLKINRLNNENISFAISPNPATDFIKIESSKKINAVKIYSINGKKVLNTTDTIINTTSLKTGAYIDAITFDNKIFTKKIIIK